MVGTWLRGALLLLLAIARSDAQSTPAPCVDSFVAKPGLGLLDPESNLHWSTPPIKIFPVSRPEECLDGCCADPRCNLAMTRFNQTCYLVGCLHGDVNLCELSPVSGRFSHQREVGRRPTQEDFCLGDAVTGPCRASHPRWWYDAAKKTCTEFIYGGCGGNLNNYLEEADCMNQCRDYKKADNMAASKRMVAADSELNSSDSEKESSSLPQSSEDFNYKEVCTQKAETGPCRASFPRWYFDPETTTCKSFTYGGCQGNQNNHPTERDCMDKCFVSKPDPQKLSGKSSSFQEYCAVSKVTGPCRASFPRWYYDTTTHSCSKFIYGGCKGNKNNYMSEDACINQCADHADEHENYDPLHPFHHSTTAVGLAVLLAVMVAILLGAMVAFFVKMARRNHPSSSIAAAWSPIDDKECLMNNAYTL